MLLKLILIFTLIPILELMILLRLGEIIGIWPTLAIVIGTGVVGAILTKAQGFLILSRIKWELSQGRLPGDELIQGLCVLIGGATLLTPGLLTDTIGFILILPFTRIAIIKWLKKKLASMLENGQLYFYIKR
jgi:UPF0716 protein FxsA